MLFSYRKNARRDHGGNQIRSRISLIRICMHGNGRYWERGIVLRDKSDRGEIGTAALNSPTSANLQEDERREGGGEYIRWDLHASANFI